MLRGEEKKMEKNKKKEFKNLSIFLVNNLDFVALIYLVPFELGCRLPSGVAFADTSDVNEFTDDNEDNTSDTGATPSDDSISSNSLLIFFLHHKIVSFKFLNENIPK